MPVAKPFEHFSHARHVGAFGFFPAVDIHCNQVGAHAAYAVQEIIDYDADIAAHLHSDIAEHETISHAMGVVAGNDAWSLGGNVFDAFHLVMEREVLAGQFEEVFGAAVIPEGECR